MPLEGEYAPPNPAAWVRDQLDEWERSGGTEGTTLRDTDMPCVIVVNRGARSGQLHKTPLMRVEHGGKATSRSGQRAAPRRTPHGGAAQPARKPRG